MKFAVFTLVAAIAAATSASPMLTTEAAAHTEGWGTAACHIRRSQCIRALPSLRRAMDEAGVSYRVDAQRVYYEFHNVGGGAAHLLVSCEPNNIAVVHARGGDSETINVLRAAGRLALENFGASCAQ